MDESRCPECGGDCSPECGSHPMGCVYGGFTEATGYWLAVEGCDRDHSGPLEPMGVVIVEDGETEAKR